MANPVICSKCNMFLGNLYFLNSKINSSAIHRKNKVYYIADDKSQYSYAYCQGCWANYAINNTLIKQKTEPAIEANYSLYLTEYAENAQNKKELMKKNLIINDLNNNVSDLKIKISKEHDNNNILTSEINLLQDTINSLKQESENTVDKINLLSEKIGILEDNICDKIEENRCSLNCLDLLKNNFCRESEINFSLRGEIITLTSQVENFNNLNIKYGMTINALEEEIIILRNYINEKESDINSLNNKFDTNKKVMKNECEYNKTEIIKLKQYICELNDYIENNMTSNELFNNVQSNLINSQKMRNELVDEIDSLRHELFNLQIKNNVTNHIEKNHSVWESFTDNNCDDENINAWDVSDDKWVIVDFNNNCIHNYDESFIDKTNDDLITQINEMEYNISEYNEDFNDNSEIDINTTEYDTDFDDNSECSTDESSSVDFNEDNQDDNNYDDFIDDLNENAAFIANYPAFVENHIKEYVENTNYSDNQYNSFTDNNENNTNCGDYTDNDFVDELDDNINTEGDFVDGEIIDDINPDNFVDGEIVDNPINSDNEYNDYIDNDFVDDLELNGKSQINNEIIDLRDSYHIECDVPFDNKIFEEYKNKKQCDMDTNYFPKKYTIIHDFI